MSLAPWKISISQYSKTENKKKRKDNTFSPSLKKYSAALKFSKK